MLRILIISLIFIIPAIQADSIQYKDPDAKSIDTAKGISNSTLKNVDLLLKQNEFLKNMNVQLDSIKEVKAGINGNLYDLKDINPEYADDRNIAKSLSEGQRFENQSKTPWTSSPIILISLSLPESYLKSLIVEAAKINTSLVLRGGIDNDIPKTINKIKSFMSDKVSCGIIIDPTLFTRFKVSTVPTFILPLEPIKTCDQNGCDIPEHVIAHGVSSLLYFLEKASRLGNEKEKSTADLWIKIYKGDNNASS